MSTNARIIVKNVTTGKFESVYLHWDGYPKHALKMLKSNYDNYVSARALVSLGDISILAETIDCPEGHDYDTPSAGCSIFYGRDRNEDSTEKVVSDTLDDSLKYDCQQYNYVFEDDQWNRVAK